MEFYCQCGAACSGSAILRYKTNPLSLSHDASAADFSSSLMKLSYGRRASSVYSSSQPVSVTMDVGSTLCSAAGTTSYITFQRESGALPAMDLRSNLLSSTSGTSPVAYFRTTQEITCVCTGVCGGSVAFVMDGLISTDIPHNTNEATLQTALQNLYTRLNKATVVNTVNATILASPTICKDSSTTTTFIEFKADSGNLPTLHPLSSITSGGIISSNAVTVVSKMRGSKENEICNAIGTCNHDNGKCDCGPFYTFQDAYGGCGKPIYNTSAWVGVETCPGVVLQSDLSVAVDKPSSLPRLYMTMGSNKTNTGLHDYVVGSETDAGPQLITNMTNMTAGAIALDLSEGYAYFVDALHRRLQRVHLHNVTKKEYHNVNPYSGELVYTNTRFTPPETTAPYGLALDLRWFKRKAYWSVPGVAGVADGQIKRCNLDIYPAEECTPEDLTSAINSAITGSLVDPKGIALDLDAERMYWVDSGVPGTVDGKVYWSNLDGTGATLLVSSNLTNPANLALDLTNHMMYITETHSSSNLYSRGSVIRTDMDYNATIGVKHIVRWIDESSSLRTPLRTPEYIALDKNNDRLIFTDTTQNKIFFASLTTPTTHGNFLSAWPIHGIRGLAWDNGHGYPDGLTPYYDCYGHGTCLGFAGNYKCECHDGWYGNCNMTRCVENLSSDLIFELMICVIHNNCNCIASKIEIESNRIESMFNTAHAPLTHPTTHTNKITQLHNIHTNSCPSGPAWFDEAHSTNDAHRMAECSNAGKCDKKRGECNCFDGFEGGACERMSCPKDELTGATCSGKGKCLTMNQLAKHARLADGDPIQYDYSRLASTNKSSEMLWDADSVQGCLCDQYWYEDGIWTFNKSDPIGYDCSLLQCPFGDNPNRPKVNLTNNYETWEVQNVVCTATSGTWNLAFRGDVSEDLPFDATNTVVENALKHMKTVGNASVAYSTGVSACTSNGANIANVTFFSEIGNLPLLTAVADKLGGSVAITEKVKGTKQNLLCSWQGTCDTTLGECRCFDGFSSSDGNGMDGLRGDCGFYGVQKMT